MNGASSTCGEPSPERRFRRLLACLLCAALAGSAFGCGSSGATDTAASAPPATDYSDYRFVEPEVTGATFYVDPVAGSRDGDGSAQHPWRTLQEVVEDGRIEYYRPSEPYKPSSSLVVVNPGAPVRGGDRLLLATGYHGHVALNTFVFKEWLTVAAGDGQTPVLSQFRLEGAFEKIYLKDLTIRKDSYDGTANYWEADEINHNSDAGVYLASDSFWGAGSRVKLNGLTVQTTRDTSGWAAADWVAKSAAGISLRSATNVEIVDCRIENVSFGLNIEYFSDNTVAVRNTIRNYSGDGCRLISNNVLLAYNTITDCLKVDDNHDDAIQSYSRGPDGSPGTGVLYNNVIRGNLIIGTTDFGNPLAGSPQGIGCFDGFFDGWTVENNVVIVDHYHGISFYGMRNGKILNNTVIDQTDGNDTSPWILVTDHKDGTPSENCLVANNIVFRSISASGVAVEARKNYVVGAANSSQLHELFANPDAFDFHLRSGPAAADALVDQGDPIPGAVSSVIDRDGVERTGVPDLGAYERLPF
jgi:Right handed beta helix region